LFPGVDGLVDEGLAPVEVDRGGDYEGVGEVDVLSEVEALGSA